MLFDLDSIECFVAAARQSSFRAAARAVSLTPAALGKRIKQLELQLGRPLFARTTRRVDLTEAGRSLLPAAESLLREAQGCIRAARGERGEPPVEVVLGTRHELGLLWVVPLLDRLAADLPHVTTHLYFSSGPDLEARVRTSEIDAAVTSRPTRDPRIASVRLHREDYVFVAHPALLKRTPLEVPDHARRHVLVDATPELPLYRYWRDAPRASELGFARVLAMGTTAAIRDLVLARKGVAVLPEFLIRGDLARKRLVRLFPDVTPLADHFRLIFRADAPRRALYEAIARTMLSFPLP